MGVDLGCGVAPVLDRPDDEGGPAHDVPGGEHTWQWRGDVDADECARIGIIRFVVPDAPGDLVVDLTLDGGDIAATNRYRSTITR